MILFRFQLWPRGRNVLAAGIYSLRGWWTVILWPGSAKSIALRLPVRALDGVL